MGTDGLAKTFLTRFQVVTKLWRLYFGEDTVHTFSMYFSTREIEVITRQLLYIGTLNNYIF